MSTPISSLMTAPVWSVGMDDTILAVEVLMAQHGLSWAPVMEPSGALVGVITLSDLMQCHRRNEDAAIVSAWQVCSYKPISVPADTSVTEVAKLMLAHKIHHVVVTEDGAMVGVVSALDYVRRCVVDVG
jgi:CBS domain-containing protein